MKKLINLVSIVLAIAAFQLVSIPVFAQETRNVSVDLSAFAESTEEDISVKLSDFPENVQFYCKFLDFINTDYSKIYIDNSESMKNTFKEEYLDIVPLMAPYIYIKSDPQNIEKVYISEKGKTALYKYLNNLEPSGTTLIVTDLWDTCSIPLETANNKSVIFFVPYKSSNAEGVEHCETVISDILDKWENSSIFIAYLDDVIVEYNNINIGTEISKNYNTPDIFPFNQ